MKKNVFAICLIVSVVALFTSCKYRYNKEKMQADYEQALEEGDSIKAAQLETRLNAMDDPEISFMTLTNEIVDYFTYKLNIDRMMDDMEAAHSAGDEAKYDKLLDRLTKLYNDPNGAMNDEQMERMEDYIVVDKGNGGSSLDEEEEDYSEEEW